ncbi:MAG: hypothetical protein JWN86_973 [Planctomycetota bacterium]|nr:hypothetical protein [Planctomycetota bacterium]
MNVRSLAIAASLLGLFVCPCSAEDLKADSAAGKRLLAEGDKLADKGDTTEAQLRYKLAFEQLLPGMRKISFKTEVKRDVTARDDLKGYLLKELDEDKTSAEYRGDELGMKAIGFIPREMNFKDVMVRVYSEEIAAFYDPKTKTMHLIREPEKKKPRGFLESLLRGGEGFNKDENKTVIAHELTHALADQNFDLDKMQHAIKNDDDRSLALSSLIEGEATLTMMAAQMNDWDGKQIVQIRAEDLDRTFSIMGPLMMMGSGAALKDAPPILAESLLFPYLRGLVLCARLVNDGGWKALDEAYKYPPLSTEQVLHPEKLIAKPDPPMAVDLGKLDAGPGWNEVTRNVVGEMQLGVLLKKFSGKIAAAGWDGDQFAAFEGPDRRLGLVWLSTWDSDDDARQFARSYLQYQTSKLGPNAKEPDAFPDSTRRPSGPTVFALERRGADVAVVEGFPSEAVESLIESAFRSKKTEKQHSKAVVR